MDVFLSWSGGRSKYIADTFYWWLPHLLQAVNPFISKRDIKKGKRSMAALAEILGEANVGIICLTPENRLEPWILFEAGALSKLASAYVCTFLYELEPSDVEPPLGQFQHTLNTKEDIRELVIVINGALKDGRSLDQRRLDETFEIWYPKFEERMARVPTPTEPATEKRTDDSKLDELLTMVRGMANPKPPLGTPGNTLQLTSESFTKKSLLRRFLLSDDTLTAADFVILLDNGMVASGNGETILTEIGTRWAAKYLPDELRLYKGK